MPIFPEKSDREEYVTSTIRLTKSLLEKLDKIAKTEGYSRNEVIVHLCGYGVRQYEEERSERVDGQAASVRKDIKLRK